MEREREKKKDSPFVPLRHRRAAVEAVVEVASKASAAHIALS